MSVHVLMSRTFHLWSSVKYEKGHVVPLDSKSMGGRIALMHSQGLTFGENTLYWDNSFTGIQLDVVLY